MCAEGHSQNASSRDGQAGEAGVGRDPATPKRGGRPPETPSHLATPVSPALSVLDSGKVRRRSDLAM